ncbi:hypothetical protein E1140_01285 [Fulvivirga lutimaris]|nr:hypothetical protein [Fulvivirga lutimaris]
MKIILKSKVKADLQFVINHFDEDLFKYLLPPAAHLIEFGGSKTGDTVHLHLPLAGEWISEITEHGSKSNLYYFIDEGKVLPFPLKKWRHKHILKGQGEHTIIEDHMSFSTGLIAFDLMFYPVLVLSFLPRLWQYKNYFKNISVSRL